MKNSESKGENYDRCAYYNNQNDDKKINFFLERGNVEIKTFWLTFQVSLY